MPLCRYNESSEEYRYRKWREHEAYLRSVSDEKLKPLLERWSEQAQEKRAALAAEQFKKTIEEWRERGTDDQGRPVEADKIAKLIEVLERRTAAGAEIAHSASTSRRSYRDRDPAEVAATTPWRTITMIVVAVGAVVALAFALR